MDRRGFLAVASGFVAAGCVGRTDTPGAGSNQTAGESDPTGTTTNRNVRTATPTARVVSTETDTPAPFTPNSDRETETRAKRAEGPPLPALTVRNAGPIGGNARRVTVTITETNDGSVVFERAGTLEPGEGVAFDEPFGEAGTYRLQARLENGTTAMRTVHVLEGGVLGYAGYTVSVSFGDIEIRRLEI